jgi:stalled ribosome alternative rescue factor ArfA
MVEAAIEKFKNPKGKKTPYQRKYKKTYNATWEVSFYFYFILFFVGR